MEKHRYKTHTKLRKEAALLFNGGLSPIVFACVIHTYTMNGAGFGDFAVNSTAFKDAA